MQAALKFSKPAKQFIRNEAYHFDLVDIWHQLLNLKGRDAYEGFILALKKKDKVSFLQYKNEFIQLLQLQDQWTGTNKNFRVGTWIN
jgi:alpha-N-acetylglucosaminidase